MRILILSNNYIPELTGPGAYVNDLAEYLIGKGDEVTIITSFPHYPHWRIYPGFRQSLFPQIIERGIRIIRCPIYIPSRPKTIQRIGYDLSYTISSLLGSFLVKDFDLLYCLSPPLTIGLTAEIISGLKRRPFIFHIMDLIPETPAALGMLNHKMVINILYRLEKHIYRRAKGIVVIAPGFKENIKRRGLAEEEKIASLSVWVDTNEIRPDISGIDFRKRIGLNQDDKVFTYAGNIGNKQGLETMLEAAALLDNPSTPKIKFLISGAGAQFTLLSKKAEDLRLKNIIIIPLQPEKDLPSLLAASDAFILTQKRSVVEICLPGKLITYCAAGKPILTAVHPQSETARFIKESQCGITCQPESAVELKEEIIYLANNPERCSQLGMNGRRFIERHYKKENVLEQYYQFIHEIIRISK